LNRPARASSVDLTGKYVPIDGKSPAVFGLIAEGRDFVACFTTMTALRRFMRRAAVPMSGIRLIEDSDDFVNRTSEALAILLDPVIDDAGVVTYVLVERVT